MLLRCRGQKQLRENEMDRKMGHAMEALFNDEL